MDRLTRLQEARKQKHSKKKAKGNRGSSKQAGYKKKENAVTDISENTESTEKDSQDLTLPAISLNRDAILAELCKRSFYRFVQEFWDTVVTEKPHWNWHIDYLCTELQTVGERVIARLPKEHDLIINVPPGTSKSTVCSIMFPVWMWTRDKSIKTITASYAAALSLEQSVKSRRIIESDKFKKLYPDIKLLHDQNVKSNYQTKEGGTRYTTSTGGMVTGLHSHLIITDDAQSPELAFSEKERKKTNEWISSTLSSRKVDKEISVMITIQQRLHPQDVTGYLLSKNKNYKHICLPATLTGHLQPAILATNYVDGLLDPIRLNNKILQEMQVDLGTRAYNTQILQNPTGDEDAIIKEKWLKIITREQYEEIRKRPDPAVNFTVDTAYTEDKKNDPSALVAYSRIGDQLFILGCSQVWKEFPAFCEHLVDYTKQQGYTSRSRILVEPKAVGLSIVQAFKKTGLNVIADTPPTSSKLERLHAISPKVEAGKVILVEGSWNSLLISEVTSNYPVHDDIRDCFIQAVSQLTRGGAGTIINRISII